MKKIIISLIVGTIICGIGIGVTIVELFGYKYSESFPYLENLPQKTLTIGLHSEDSIDITNLDFNFSYDIKPDKIKYSIIENKSAITPQISIKYRGSLWYNILQSENTEQDNSTSQIIYLNAFDDFFCSFEYIKAAFKNKTFYPYISCVIDEIIITTDNPNDIIIDY